MKITSTHDLLVIDTRPWVSTVVLSGCFFGFLAWMVALIYGGKYLPASGVAVLIALTLWFMWAYVRRNQLVLNGVDQTMIHRRRTLFSYRQVSYNLSDLSEAFVEPQPSGEKGPPHFRMVLRIIGGMDAGDLAFIDAYLANTNAERATTAVNDWLVAYRGHDRAGTLLDSHPPQA